MKDFHFLKLFCLILIVSIFNACKDCPCDDIACLNAGVCEDGECICPIGYEGNTCEDRLYLLQRINLNGEVYRQFSYDDENRISEFSQTGGNNQDLIYNYEYGEDSVKIQLIRSLDMDTSYLIYHQKSDTRLDISIIDPSNNVRNSSYFNLDTNCGYINGETYSLSNELFRYQEYNYYGNCSYTENTYNASTDELIFVTEVEADESRFIHQSNHLISFPQHNHIAKKNIRKVSYYDADGIIIPVLSYESIFVTNSDNMPVRETRNIETGETEIYEFIYH